MFHGIFQPTTPPRKILIRALFSSNGEKATPSGEGMRSLTLEKIRPDRCTFSAGAEFVNHPGHDFTAEQVFVQCVARKAVRALTPPRAGFPDRGGGYIDSDRGDSPARLARADAINPGSVPGLFAFPAAISCRSSRRGVLTTRNPMLLLMLSGVLLLRCDARQLLELLFQLPPRNKRFKVIFGTKPQTGYAELRYSTPTPQRVRFESDVPDRRVA